jgi:predicted RNA polymerase sigma factor
VHGLVALMELQVSRTPARTTADGSPVPLQDQDRRRWDRLLIRRGLGGTGPGREHLRSLRPAGVDRGLPRPCPPTRRHRRERITALYEILAHVAPSPVVELNRAVAVNHAHGPSPALAIIDALVMPNSPLLPAVPGDLLRQPPLRG